VRDRYPEIEPHEQGMLDVGDGQRIYWEVSGNPDGKPAVFLHGGPGSGSRPGQRRWFDPAAYRIVQFDQRGCGRSTPSASDPATDLTTNTTHHLVRDMEALREHLGIDRWLVAGASWGVTLALAYAERHPERVTEMLLVSVTASRRSDVHWIAHEAGRFLPEEWARFRAGVPEGARDDLVAAYDRLLNHQPDDAVREQAARDWTDWEDALISLEDDEPSPPSQPSRFADAAFRMTFARLVTHYFSHAGFLEEDEVLRNVHGLHGIPAVLVHGRFDIQGPADVAWQLAQAWPDAELHFVRTGHSGGDEMMDRVIEATDRLRW